MNSEREVAEGPDEPDESADPLLRGAVLAMSRSGDVVHPLDKRSTVKALKSMRIAGVPINPEAIRTEALDQGWSIAGANRLRELATKVSEGRRVHGAGKVTKAEAREAIARWQAAEGA